MNLIKRIDHCLLAMCGITALRKSLDDNIEEKKHKRIMRKFFMNQLSLD